MRFVRVAVLVAGCSSTHKPAPATVANESTAEQHKGEVVVIFDGKAQNTKLGKAIEVGDLTVYCLDAHWTEWPSNLLGYPISVKGKLERTDELGAPQPSAGASTSAWVLRDCELGAAP